MNINNYFPRSEPYKKILRPSGNMVKEKSSSAYTFHFSERHLQCVWFDPFYRPDPLISNNGEKIIIETPGRWNLEAGPDFLDAVLLIEPSHRRIKGDVEIHISPNDWLKHGHNDNAEYSNIIAHISYFPGSLQVNDLPSGTIQISLLNHLKSNPAFCFESIDITAYPYKTLYVKTPQCAQILSSWSVQDIETLLESAGEERLRRKTERIYAGIKERGLDQLLYEEIMYAFGYKHNRIPFRQLASLLPANILRKEADNNIYKAYSLLLGLAGLIPTKISTQWDNETRSFIRQLWDNWWKQRTKWEPLSMPVGSWRLSGLRPQNHPIRRLAAAAALFTHETNFLSKLAVINMNKSWFKDVGKLFQKMAHMDYWTRRLSFSGTSQISDIALIGPGRTAAILSNVIIPFLAATGTSIQHIIPYLSPEDDNSIIRQTAYALLGRDHNPSLYNKSGIRQQGLMQIFHDFCLNDRSTCSNCQFVSALTPIFHK